MQIESLEVSGLRNLKAQKIDFSPLVNLLRGRNGQGKTSVLEAVFLLSHGKSFRTSRTADLICWQGSEQGQREAVINGIFSTAEGRKEVLCRLSPGNRLLFINGKRIDRASAFFGQTRSIVFTPEELQIVKGAPALRRHFLDRILAMTDAFYVESLVHYQRALKNRNKVISQSERSAAGSGQENLLGSWDAVLSSHARVIVERRLLLVRELEGAVKEIYGRLAGDARSQESVSCMYFSQLIADGAVISEQEIALKYHGSWAVDLKKGTTSIGPQRDELRLLISSGYTPRDSRQAASQGQARSIALALTIAAAQWLRLRSGEPPVVLLDDVESELDEGRKRALAGLLKNIDAQAVITTTGSSALISELQAEASELLIEDGKIKGPIKHN